jgi:hypothetical protein
VPHQDVLSYPPAVILLVSITFKSLFSSLQTRRPACEVMTESDPPCLVLSVPANRQVQRLCRPVSGRGEYLITRRPSE